MNAVDRCWLLTWTTYGTWLPGDHRGSTSPRRTTDGASVRRNTPGLPAASALPGLERWARARQRDRRTLLTQDDARVVARQFHETAWFRGWTLLAYAVMRNHVHAVVGVPGDPDPATLLLSFKSYASRALNRLHGERRRWWTASRSRRRLRTEAHVAAAVRYVQAQQYPLVVWTHSGFPELW